MPYKIWKKSLNRLNVKIATIADNLALHVLATSNVAMQEKQACRIKRLTSFKWYLLCNCKVV